MAQQANRLCEHILFDHFGEIVGQVGATLLARGRLSLAELRRLIPLLLPSEIQASILVLTQHNLLFHAKHPDTDIEFFQLDREAVLQRRRFGLFANIAEENWGDEAAECVLAMCREGKILLGRLLQQLAKNDSKRKKRMTAVIHLFLSLQILKPISANAHMSRVDRDIAYQRKLVSEFKAPPTPKDMREVKQKVLEHAEEEDSIAIDWGGKDINEGQVVYEDAHTGSKRKISAINYAEPLRTALPFREDIWVKLSYDRFLIKVRNKLLERSVKQYFGLQAAIVMRVALYTTDSSAKHVSQTSSDKFSTQQLSTGLNVMKRHRSPSKNLDMRQAFGPSGSNISYPVTKAYEAIGTHSSSGHKNQTASIAEICEIMGYNDDSRPHYTELESAYLDKSAYRAIGFFKPVSDSTGIPDVNDRMYGLANNPADICWAVDFVGAAEKMRRGIVEGMIKARFSEQTLRVWRVLEERSMIEEKHVGKLALMAAKDVRESLTSLHDAGYIIQQEVPRSADRAPSRTFYLFHVSLPSIYTNLIEQHYQTLVNIYVKRQAVQHQFKDILAIMAREDINWDISVIQDDKRKEEWAAYEWTIENLNAAEERTDMDLFTLESLPSLGW